MSLSRCVGSKLDCACVHFYEKIQYVKHLWTIDRRFDEHPLRDLGLSDVLLCHRSRHPYVLHRFDYWAPDCDFELRLLCHAWGMFARRHDVELFVFSPLHLSIHYIGILDW